MRRGGDIFVGDYVDFGITKDSYGVIEKILQRKNYMIRPYVANIDKAIILIANEPKPDMLLVDKIIINCYTQGIEPVLCYNKSDIADKKEIEEVFCDYKELKTLRMSAVDKDGIEELKLELKDSLVCFLGQSAVGKSSLLNTLLEEEKAEVGGLSEKIKRGKNTTRHIEIFEVLEGRIVDTCGFSMLECVDIKPEELCYYYDEYVHLAPLCKYSSCLHTVEPQCKVREEVEKGNLSKNRYDRYLTIFNELKEKARKKYD